MNIDKFWNILKILAFFLLPVLIQMAQLKLDPDHCRREELSGDVVCQY